jgi:hypothetical protein
MSAPYNRNGMAKPPITITCECGQNKKVPYGATWQCEQCGRSWNTQQIPAEDYDDLLRRMRRHKLEAVGAGVLALAIFAPLVVLNARFFLLLPPAMMIWLFVLLPYWRRRYRRTAYSAPRWQLHPE